MKEIEIKIPVNARESGEAEARLRACYSKEPILGTRILDRYFDLGDRPWALRIREVRAVLDGVAVPTSFLTLKARKKVTDEPEDGVCSRDEYEPILRPDDVRSWLQILEHLGLNQYAVVDKVRAEYDLGAAKVAFDTVKGLGLFIEIEASSHDDTEARAKIKEVRYVLGLELSVPEKRGYLDLILEHKKHEQRSKTSAHPYGSRGYGDGVGQNAWAYSHLSV